MKYKVAELEGALLDAAVTQAQGVGWHLEETNLGLRCIAEWGIAEDNWQYRPSVSFRDAGLIIYREKISVLCKDRQNDVWVAATNVGTGPRGWRNFAFGPKPQIAAMRCYVASVYGEEVEL